MYMRKAPQLNGMLMFSDLQYMIAFSCWALVLFIGYTANIYLLPRQRYVLAFYFQSVLLQSLEAALVRTNYKLSEAKLRIHVLYRRISFDTHTNISFHIKL